MAAKKKEEEVVELGNVNKNVFDILKQNKEDHFNFEDRVDWSISSGSLLIDSCLVGGYLKPCLVRLTGSNGEGKTPQALEFLRNLLNTVPNSRGVWFLAEGRLSEQNRERCGLKFTIDPNDWNDGEILIIETNVYELVIKLIKSMVVNNPEKKVYGFCIDSLDGLILKGDKDKTAEEATKVAGPQLLSKKMMASLSLGMFKYGHLLIMISQVTAEIKLDPYSKAPNRGGSFSGGNSLLHQADFIISYSSSYASDYILDNPSGKLNDGKSKPIGKYARITFDKSISETSKKQTVMYPIKFGQKPSGIWREYEVADMLLQWELITKAGAWLTFSDSLKDQLKGFENVPDKIQGVPKLREWLEENPEITNLLFLKFKEILCS